MEKKEFSIESINVSEKKGMTKKPIESAEIKENHGIVGDAHAGDWHRQISMLASEEIENVRPSIPQIKYGDFAENITTKGIDLAKLPIGSKIFMGDCEFEVTQIGKECHAKCYIHQITGDCIMPRSGIFVKVLKGGHISNASSCYYTI